MERAARARRWEPKDAVLRERPALRRNGLARASQAGEAKTWKEGYWGTTARQQNGEGRGGRPGFDASVGTTTRGQEAEQGRQKEGTAVTKTVVTDVVSPRQAPGGGGLRNSLLLGVAVGVAASVSVFDATEKEKIKRSSLHSPLAKKTDRRSGSPQSFLKLKSKAKEKHNRMHYLSTSAEDSTVLSVPKHSMPTQSVEFALNSNTGVRLDEIEEDIDRLYTGLEKMVEESRQTNERVNRAVATSSGQSEKGSTERLERDLSIVNEEQRNSRQLLSELERKLEEVSRGATQQENKIDSHVDKTTEGFQDAIEALGIMKEKIENFESKLEQLEHWGSGSTDAIAERLNEVEKERWVYLESAEEQSKRMDEFGRMLEDLSDKSSFLSDEVEQLIERRRKCFTGEKEWEPLGVSPEDE